MIKTPNIKIFVTHFNNPNCIYEDDIFIPIQAWKKNSKIDLWIQWDDTWDNISEKNPQYAELTTQYWVWKNYDLSDVDYVWFCHYRRYMTYNFRYNKFKFWNNFRKIDFDNFIISVCLNLESIWRFQLWKCINLSFNSFGSGQISTFSNSIANFIGNCDIYLPKQLL